MKNKTILLHFRGVRGAKRTVGLDNHLEQGIDLPLYLSADRQDHIISLIQDDTGVVAAKPILATFSG